MSTLAVEVSAVGNPHSRKLQGILSATPQVGNDCVIYLGGENFFCIAGIKGWLIPTGGDYIILFDNRNARYRVQVLASSRDFL